MTQIAAAWYADPAGSGQLRYWDGAAWTNHLRDPEPVAPPASLSFPPPRPTPYGSPSSAAVDPANPFGSYLSGFSGNQVAAGVQITQGALGSSGGPGIGGSIGLIVVGIVIFFGGTLLTNAMDASTTPAAGSVSGTGRVVELRMDEGVCSPVVEFTANGETYLAYALVGQQPCPFRIGDSAELTYLPSSPESSVRLQSDASGAGIFKIAIMGFSGLFMLIGVVTLVRRVLQLSREGRAWRTS